MSFFNRNFSMFFTNNKGFTLIELLVVISIVGTLSTIVLSSLSSARAKARDARRISDIKQITTALFLLADNNNGNFPTTGGIGKCLGTVGSCWNGNILGDATLNDLIFPFMPSIPIDPSGRNGKGDRYVYLDQNASVAWHCDGSLGANNGVPYPKGPYILWQPENIDPHSDILCKNMGFIACCFSGDSCTNGYYCAYKIE